jgi:predicted acyl esterase
MSSLHRRTWLFALIASLVAELAGQCPDPPTPPAGFPIAVVSDQLVTFTDQLRTRADLRHPAVAPGPCGWPLLIAVHGFPGTKAGPVGAQAAALAQLGYCVVTYDVRGQGSAIALNPGRGTTLMALEEWIDLFEIIEWAAAAHPGLVDLGRVGVLGISQGGAHAWAAAAWSGRTPPPNARRSAPFPVVRVAAPTVMVPSHSDAATQDGTAFINAWANLAYAPPGPMAVLDSSLQATMRAYMQADDPAGMHAWMRSDPGRDFQHLLTSSTTAVFTTMAWHDESMAPNSALRALASMPATTPKRAFLTTGLHGTPTNTYEAARADRLREAWFARFLKGSAEPVELGPPVLSALLPANRADYLQSAALWRHRADADLALSSATPTTYYLRQGAALSTAAPSSNEPPEAVLHSVPAGYDLNSWRADGAGQNLSLALSRIPLSSHAYLTAPFAVDTELAGIPRLLLEVTPNHTRFQLTARLEVVPPTGTPQVIAQGGVGVRQSLGPAPASVAIELSATACVIPVGGRLRLSVRNHSLVIPAATEIFRYMPFFVSSRVDLEHRLGAASRLLLPLRGTPSLDLTTTATEIALPTPLPIALRVQSSASRAGLPYVLLASLLGQGPPLPLPGGDLLYLQLDGFSFELLGLAGSPLLPGFAGSLDANGRASASLQLNLLAPLPLELSGWNLHLAPLAIESGVLRAGASRELRFR